MLIVVILIVLNCLIQSQRKIKLLTRNSNNNENHCTLKCIPRTRTHRNSLPSEIATIKEPQKSKRYVKFRCVKNTLLQVVLGEGYRITAPLFTRPFRLTAPLFNRLMDAPPHFRTAPLGSPPHFKTAPLDSPPHFRTAPLDSPPPLSSAPLDSPPHFSSFKTPL